MDVHPVQNVLDFFRGTVHFLIQPVRVVPKQIGVKPGDVPDPIQTIPYLLRVVLSRIHRLLRRAGKGVSRIGNGVQLLLQLLVQIFFVGNRQMGFQLSHNAAGIFSACHGSVIAAVPQNAVLASGDSAGVVPPFRVPHLATVDAAGQHAQRQAGNAAGIVDPLRPQIFFQVFRLQGKRRAGRSPFLLRIGPLLVRRRVDGSRIDAVLNPAVVSPGNAAGFQVTGNLSGI